MKPNFEGFAREIVGEHPDLIDWNSTDIMEAAIRHGLFAAVPGGFDPAKHSHRFHRDARPGDTHYELTYDIADPRCVEWGVIEWKPISSAPFGKSVLLYFPHGERGHPAIACGQNWSEPPDAPVWWGPGGPNAGLELDMSMGDYDDGPTLWAEVEPLLALALEVSQKLPTAGTTHYFHG